MSNTELPNVKAALQIWATKLAELYKSKLPVASGSLKNSVKANVIEQGGSLEVVFDINEAWKFVEEGRAPGTFPPIDEIKKWIQVKNLMPRPYTLPNGKQLIPSQNQLAFLIGRKIKEKGIEARPYLEESINELESELYSLVEEALVKDVESNLQQAIG